MSRLPLFDVPKPKTTDPTFDPSRAMTIPEVPYRADGPDTSRKAAADLSFRVGSLRQRVLEAVRLAGDTGITICDLEYAWGERDRDGSISPRFAELAGKNRAFPYRFIRDSGRRRKNIEGQEAIVWVALDVPEDVDPADYPDPCPRCGGSGVDPDWAGQP